MATPQDLTAIEQAISTAIGQQETGGGVAGVGASLNNPGGLKWASDQVQFGAVRTSSGFARFPSLEQGRAAMMALVDKYVRAGNSLSTLIQSWSPASDNNVNNEARIAQLGQITGLDPQLPIAAQAQAQAPGADSGAIDWAGTMHDIGTIRDIVTGKALANSWSRVAAFVCGVIFLGVGLVSLNKSATVVVKNFGKGLAAGAKDAVIAA